MYKVQHLYYRSCGFGKAQHQALLEIVDMALRHAFAILYIQYRPQLTDRVGLIVF